jgi:hypothetical protein
MTETKEWVLQATDRCDEGMCYAQAYVRAKAIDGELDFCVHHYDRHLKLPGGAEKMAAFAFEVIDERERLIENRLQGED